MSSTESSMTEPGASLMWYDQPVFRAYAFYACILIVKMTFMSFYTGVTRLLRKVVQNPEDIKLNGNAEIKFDDPRVERIRRGHQNDIENITLFYIAGFVYAMTQPSPVLAINLYRVYTASRIIHTIVYTVVVLPQPSRTLVWNVGITINLFMVGASLYHYFDMANI